MTLTEILVVVAILGILILLAALSLNPKLQLMRTRDGRRKADLKRIAIALEDFAGDKPCYPTMIYKPLSGCTASEEIDPYLPHIPCDPLTKAPYLYIRPGCKEFIIYTTLEIETNNDYGAGNYAVSSPNLRIIPTVSPTQAPSPTSPPPSPTAGPVSPPSTSFFGCFNSVCHELSGSGECKPNYQNASDCVEEECCTLSGVYMCEGGQNECEPEP